MNSIKTVIMWVLRCLKRLQMVTELYQVWCVVLQVVCGDSPLSD